MLDFTIKDVIATACNSNITSFISFNLIVTIVEIYLNRLEIIGIDCNGEIFARAIVPQTLNSQSIYNMKQWRQKAKELKREIYALTLACQNPKVPWYVKLLATCTIAYALSPIDLIPDFIPVLGLLDDLILLPLAIMSILKLIPPDIMDDCRRQAETAIASPQNKSYRRSATVIIISIWFLSGILLVLWLKNLSR